MKKLENIFTGAGLTLIIAAAVTRKSFPTLSLTFFILSTICCLGETVATFIREGVIEPRKEKDLLSCQTKQKDGDTHDPR